MFYFCLVTLSLVILIKRILIISRTVDVIPTNKNQLGVPQKMFMSCFVVASQDRLFLLLSSSFFLIFIVIISQDSWLRIFVSSLVLIAIMQSHHFSSSALCNR